MRVDFVESVLRELLNKKVVARTDSLLAVCASDYEERLFSSLGFRDVTLSNLDNRVMASDVAPLKWSFQDAQNLTFSDAQFDYVFVSDGLHHCASPHRALLEMYRVARKGIVMFEGRDGLLMRLANKMNLVFEYELEAVVDNDFLLGGVNNTQIPNYVYRWTERELKKTIQAFNPSGSHKFNFFYGLSLPYETSAMKKSSLKLNMVRAIAPFMWILTRIFKRLNNLFAMVAMKPGPEDFWPWLEKRDGVLQFKRGYAESIFKKPH